MGNRLFSSVPFRKPKRNAFNLSHDVKLTCKMGQLVPILCEPVVPGDTWKDNTEVFMRLSPMLAPVMHEIKVYTHFFFVPNRLIWDQWEEFITGGEDGTATPHMPSINFGALAWQMQRPGISDAEKAKLAELSQIGSLADYLGLPCGYTYADLHDDVWNLGVYGLPINILPFRAYQLIYNEFYRDQNLQEEVEFTRGDYDNASGRLDQELINLLTLRNRCWEKDYFSSALPHPQRGTDVHIPMTGDADVYTDTKGIILEGQVNQMTNYSRAGDPYKAYGAVRWESNGADDDYASGDFLANNTGEGDYSVIRSATPLKKDDIQRMNLKADMSNVTAATINELRRATRLQAWLEKNARGGARYIEQILSHFGVRSSDSRLQRPEFLGGGKSPVVISEVLQMSSTDSTSPQGNMAGHGINVSRSHTFKRFFEEHGYVIGIMSIVPRSTYQQGTPREWLKTNKFDYYFPEFANLGEQEIYKEEIYSAFEAGYEGKQLFGYTPRYAEYKFLQNRVCGDFKKSLNYWHLGRIFDNQPELNANFVQLDEKTDGLSRIFAAEKDPDTKVPYDHFYCYIRNNLTALRPMPKYGVPTF